MARPPQFERPDDPTRDITAVKAAVKRLRPSDRAALIAWLLLYYQDDGSMFSLEIDRRRHRITFNGVEFWLVRVPQRVKKGEKEFNGQQSTA
ncbi:MAG: hypothetical protein WBE30_14135 [Candidatus Cybelea sp.]|jgi:hypothetical protein